MIGVLLTLLAALIGGITYEHFHPDPLPTVCLQREKFPTKLENRTSTGGRYETWEYKCLESVTDPNYVNPKPVDSPEQNGKRAMDGTTMLGMDMDIAEGALRIVLNKPAHGKFPKSWITPEQKLDAAITLLSFEQANPCSMSGKYGKTDWDQYEEVKRLYNLLRGDKSQKFFGFEDNKCGESYKDGIYRPAK